MSNRIEGLFTKHLFMTNGAHKGELKKHSDLLIDQAREILRAAFKRHSTDGTPNGLLGWNLGKLLIILNDPFPSEVREAIKIAEKENFDSEFPVIQEVLKLLYKIKVK